MFSLLCRLPGWYKNAAENKNFLYYKKVLIFLLTKFSTLLHGFYHSDRNVLFQGATNVPLVKAGQAPLFGHHKSRPHSFPNGGDAFSLFRAAFFCRSIMILDRDYRNPPHHRTLLPQTLSLGVQGKVVCSGMDNHTIAKFHFLPDWSCPASADALPHSVLACSGLSLPVSRSVTNVSVTPIWSCQCTVEGTV